jgi:hypothetical protein
MKKIYFNLGDVEAEIEVTDLLIQAVANRFALPADSITDYDLVKFFSDAVDPALASAPVEYLASDAKTA